jgi:ectoine hydroxylase-related dioxygenase (phytanoyl-CoA dioxygenase family)
MSVAVDESILRRFADEGFAVVANVLDAAEVAALRLELEAAIAEDLCLRPHVFDRGMVHNCMVRGQRMASLLDQPVMNAYLEAALSPTCILYAYQSSSLPPGEGNYGSRVHVDCPRFIPGYATNLGVIFALDDFTEQNGATWYLPGSHLREALPDDASFWREARRGLCRAGDMILFQGRLAHAAGVNHTARTRHALTLNICRSFMRQRFDFPRLVPPVQVERLGAAGRRLIGMNVRMPTSLDEFYLPPDQRLYLPGQG